MSLNRQIRVAALLFVTITATRPAPAQIPGIPSPKSPATPQPAERDALGRDTPYGSIIGFLKAAQRGEYSRAVEYLDIRPSADAEERASQLLTVMNSGLLSDLETVSKVPEGDLNDGLPPDRERVGTIRTGSETLDILLRRVTRAGLPVWLVSSETLRRVPGVYEQLDTNWIERFIPAPLREIRILSVPVYRWLETLLGVLLALGAAWLGSSLLFALVRPLVRRITRNPDDRRLLKLRAPLWLILWAVGFRILAVVSSTVLGRQFWIKIAAGIAILGAAWLVVRVSDIVAEHASRRLTRLGLESKLALLALVHRAFKITVGVAGIVALIYAAGHDVTALLAGLGLGGVAIAFAAQKTLENLFGGVSIISDEPIRVGDFCRFADKFGTVQDIGLRSTRVRTVDRTMLSIPNGQLSVMTLENLTLRDKLLFKHRIGLRYDTSPAQLRGILSEIRELLRSRSDVDSDGSRVRLVEFADSAFTIEIFAYVLTSDYLLFLEIQEDLLLAILDLIVAGGSGLAYPSQTMYLSRDKPADAFLVDQAAARSRERRNQAPAAPSEVAPLVSANRAPK